jgi:hypothetical protein
MRAEENINGTEIKRRNAEQISKKRKKRRQTGNKK